MRVRCIHRGNARHGIAKLEFVLTAVTPLEFDSTNSAITNAAKRFLAAIQAATEFKLFFFSSEICCLENVVVFNIKSINVNSPLVQHIRHVFVYLII